MTDAVVTPGAIALTGTGLTVLGMATGLHPLLLIAGAAGGYWGLTYVPPMSLGKRLGIIALSALAAAWGSPIIAAPVAALIGIGLSQLGINAALPIDHPALGALLSLGLGTLANPVLVPALVRQARARTDTQEATQ